MKIAQLIYTSVKYSLSDSEIGLFNEPGYRVYSCTQGLSADEINEIVRFCGYKLPKNTNIKYSKIPFDPEVPDLFPKTFRTFKTDTGKYVAVQVVYSGVDPNGEDGNFFAHALIFEDYAEDFRPESFYGSGIFRKWLTPEEQNCELVRYLPYINEYDIDDELWDKVDNFVYNHKVQMSSVLDQAMAVFADNGKTHICISAKNQEESDYYVLGLKRILPPGFADSFGISTNNIFLPSAGQSKILINGTISGRNNIADDDIEHRTNCVYIDVQRIETDGVKPMKLFEMTFEELYESYKRFSIRNGKQLQVWMNSYERLNEQGVGDRLRALYNLVGAELFKERTLALYEKLDQNDYKQVKFEVLEVMCEHADIFSEISEDIVFTFADEGINCITSGEPKNIENVFKNIKFDVADKIYKGLMERLPEVKAELFDEKSGILLLRVYSLIKASCNIKTWIEFFAHNEEFISVFLEICAKVMIGESLPVTITAPPIWTVFDTAEVIALFDSSTEDKVLKKACRKYIVENKNTVWSNYGVTLQKRRKSKEDADKDLQKIKKMLTQVGYSPYQRSTYNDLKFEVINEMTLSENPLLLVRLLYYVYQWQGCDSTSTQSQQYADNVAEYILEIKETQSSLYNYIFPKLALEILDSPGIHHEIMINSETMDNSFWQWFYIGFKRNKHNESIRANYQRVAEFSKSRLSRYPFYRNIFK